MKRIVLAIMLVLGFGLNVYASSTPESVITSFLEAVRSGDIKKAKSYLDKDSFIKPKNIMKPQLGKKDTLDGELGLVDNMFNQGGKDNRWTYDIKFNNTWLNNPDNRGYYGYIVKMETVNYDLTKSYTLKKVNNTWLIVGWI
ncbi:hypothetical protein [Aliarcobacter cryaerophilus]|uniref:hypothetical protein n=1 Tax=Aliarcobacter cryaerophilus TaxID=28198 RepID=UPI003DA6B5D1